MTFLERLIIRKDIESYLSNHAADLKPYADKLLPFLRPSLVAWAEKYPKDMDGVLCDCILKAFNV